MAKMKPKEILNAYRITAVAGLLLFAIGLFVRLTAMMIIGIVLIIASFVFVFLLQCSHCGKQLDMRSAGDFCPFCGKKLNE